LNADLYLVVDKPVLIGEPVIRSEDSPQNGRIRHMHYVLTMAGSLPMDLQQVEKNVIATIVGAIGIGIGTATQSAQGQGFCYEKPPFERCPPRSNAFGHSSDAGQSSHDRQHPLPLR
jgi:hypothetical protein